MTDVLKSSDLPQQVQMRCFPDRDVPDRVGLELELFVLDGGRHGKTPRRAPIHGPSGTRAAVSRAAAQFGWRDTAVGAIDLAGGGNISWEPGGQIELSPHAHDTVDAALDQLSGLVTSLSTVLRSDALDLVSAGTDQWTDREAVAQQLDKPRYRAMDEHFRQLGPWGQVMMRHTASLQVNLDAGSGVRRTERWSVANLLSPLTIGTFASSPTEALDVDGAWSAVSERSIAWHRLDPSRTGVPRLFCAGEHNPVRVMTDACLSAEVMYVQECDGSVLPHRRGWTFADWMAGDGPRPATTADLDVHLSTLFHDVRPRGPLELRTVDALPAVWRDVPAVLLVGALYDDEALARLRGLLEPMRAQLPQRCAQAAQSGLKDPALCALAVEVWSFALEGASRLGVSSARLEGVEDYLERFTLRGLTPADHLAALHPAAAFELCLEPVTSSDHVDAP